MTAPAIAQVVDLRPSTHHPLPEGLVNGAQLATLTGLSYRQVDFWTRSGYLHPVETSPGSGHQWMYPPSEVTAALLMATLVEAGLLPAVAYGIASDLLDLGVAHIAGMPIHLPQEY